MSGKVCDLDPGWKNHPKVFIFDLGTICEKFNFSAKQSFQTNSFGQCNIGFANKQKDQLKYHNSPLRREYFGKKIWKPIVFLWLFFYIKGVYGNWLIFFLLSFFGDKRNFRDLWHQERFSSRALWPSKKRSSKKLKYLQYNNNLNFQFWIKI